MTGGARHLRPLLSLDLGDFSLGHHSAHTVNLLQDGDGLQISTSLDQVIRRLRHEDHQDELNHSKDAAQSEHDPPAGRHVSEDEVDDEGEEEAEGDAQLVECDEPAPDLGCRYL